MFSGILPPNFLRSNSTAFGAVLFGSFIAITFADIFNIRKGSRRWFGLSKLRGMATSLMKRDSLKDGSNAEGNLVVCGSTEFSRGLWRQSVSNADCEDDDSSSIECEMEVINDIDEQVLLCWVHPDGSLKHFHPINDRSIRDNSVSNHHIEFTQCGHAFICLKASCEPLPLRLSDVSEEAFVFYYKPEKALVRHILSLRKATSSNSNSSNDKGGSHHLRGSITATSDADFSIVVDFESQSFLDCRGEVIDTSSKPYCCRTIAGFSIKYEDGVFEAVPGFEDALIADVQQLRRLIPAAACDRLAADTVIWVNKSITYGTSKRPVVGACATYHPIGGADWLQKNGMHVEKEGCVELFSAQSYLRSRDHWGLGGIMLHEFAHAFHNKCCEGRFDCEAIRKAYSIAMRDKRYDSVPVHGPQGQQGNAKAYACTNCMEFFAELSVAYFWVDDADTEFNKWFPYNRSQLQQHDPPSFDVLHQQWTQFESTTLASTSAAESKASS